ncbi:MAG: OmpW family outer membrane protein [Xanthomonadales bacterium]|nr:OmpW family outer membrane protein [Xanthomonadales bacterium]
MKSKLIIAVLAALIAVPASAFEAGDWMVRAGITNVDPKSDNHPVVDADAGAALNLNATYMWTENWAIDILAAIPFNHELYLVDGGAKVGETDQLPPTVSIQYHFMSNQKFRPYVGLGLNYTTFFDEKTRGPLAGSDLDLDDSFGLAAQIGFDYMLDDHWFANLDARWMDIDTEAKLDGTSLGDVEIDPLVYGFSFGYRF